jgi:hypothetical protein
MLYHQILIIFTKEDTSQTTAKLQSAWIKEKKRLLNIILALTDQTAA